MNTYTNYYEMCGHIIFVVVKEI